MARQLLGIIALGLFLGSHSAKAAQGFHIFPGTTNILNTYSLLNPQLVFNTPNGKHLLVQNGCSPSLVFTFTNTAVTPLDSFVTNPLQMTVGPGTATAPTQARFEFLGSAKYMWIKSGDNKMSAAACEVDIDVW